jgi:hypothetical protein
MPPVTSFSGGEKQAPHVLKILLLASSISIRLFLGISLFNVPLGCLGKLMQAKVFNAIPLGFIQGHGNLQEALRSGCYLFSLSPRMGGQFERTNRSVGIGIRFFSRSTLMEILRLACYSLGLESIRFTIARMHNFLKDNRAYSRLRDEEIDWRRPGSFTAAISQRPVHATFRLSQLTAATSYIMFT